MNGTLLAGIAFVSGLALVSVQGTHWVSDFTASRIRRLHARLFGFRKPRRRLARRRHQTSATLATAVTGVSALILSVMPLKGGTIPFAPGTDIGWSVLQGSLIAIGFGLAIGTYTRAKRFAEDRERVLQGPSKADERTPYVQPSILTAFKTTKANMKEPGR